MIKVSSAQLWVHDQDEALAFYRDKVGLQVRSDVTVPELGNFRWLTVGPAGQDDVGIVLMADRLSWTRKRPTRCAISWPRASPARSS